MAQQTENNNMTAVERLHKQFMDTFYVAESSELGKRFDDIFQQAKQMEKEQIIMAHCHNRCLNDKTYECSIKAFENSEQYYNETYGNNQ